MFFKRMKNSSDASGTIKPRLYEVKIFETKEETSGRLLDLLLCSARSGCSVNVKWS